MVAALFGIGTTELLILGILGGAAAVTVAVVLVLALLRKR